MNKRRAYDDAANDAPASSQSYAVARQVPKFKGRMVIRKKKPSARDAAMLKQVKAMVKKMIQIPRTWKLAVATGSGTVANAVASTSGTYYNISFTHVDEGNDWNDRTGREIELKRVGVNFSLTASGTPGDVLVAILGNISNPPGDISYTSSDLKVSTAGATKSFESSTGISDMLIPWNGQRYKCVYEEVFLLAQSDIQMGSMSTVYRSVDLTRFFPKKIQFNDTNTSTGCPQLTLAIFPLTTTVAPPTYKAVTSVQYCVNG